MNVCVSALSQLANIIFIAVSYGNSTPTSERCLSDRNWGCRRRSRDLIFSQFSKDCSQNCVCLQGSAHNPAGGGLTVPPDNQLENVGSHATRNAPVRL